MENRYITKARDKPLRLLRNIGSSVLFVSLASVAYAEMQDDFEALPAAVSYGAIHSNAPVETGQTMTIGDGGTLSLAEVLLRQKNLDAVDPANHNR